MNQPQLNNQPRKLLRTVLLTVTLYSVTFLIGLLVLPAGPEKNNWLLFMGFASVHYAIVATAVSELKRLSFTQMHANSWQLSMALFLTLIEPLAYFYIVQAEGLTLWEVGGFVVASAITHWCYVTVYDWAITRAL
jgi:hypothetical protein